MAGRGSGSDFVEALARGLDIIEAFGEQPVPLSLSQVAERAQLPRPTARRLLLTLAELGFVRSDDGRFTLTPQVLRLGMAYVGSLGLWEMARPHLADLVRETGESSSMSQLDGSDIVYVARVAVPKIIAMRVEIGTRFPAVATSQGKVLLAHLDPVERDRALAEPGRSGVLPAVMHDRGTVEAELRDVRSRGWAVADEELARGIRSIAVPVRDGDGRVRAAMNVTVHAAETPVETLTDDYLPLLIRAAGQVSLDWARWMSRPQAGP